MKLRLLLPWFAGFVPVVGLWSLGTWAFSPEIIPWLPQVLGHLGMDLLSKETWENLALTLGRTLAGFLLAFALGLPLGVWMGRSSGVDSSLFLPVILLQACPPLFWVIPLILTLGTDGQAPIAVVFLVVFPLVVLNVRDARRAIPETAFDLFAIYAPSRRLVWSELLLPALTAALRASLVLGLVVGLKSSVIGEWFGSHSGLGRAIYRFYGIFDMPGFFALVFLFLVVGAAIGLASQAFADHFLPERRPGNGANFRPLELLKLPPSRIEFQGVGFSWGAKHLLKNFHLTIQPGEAVVLVGPSGCGKTTLARLALGLLVPRDGLISSPKRRAVLFQEDGLLHHRTVLANVLLPAWEQRRVGAQAQAHEFIARVGLAGEEENYPSQLSGGMKKRVALARALMQEPDFFVLDEPFQNLDGPSREQLWDLVFQVLNDKGLGALIITHYPDELAQRPVTRVMPFPTY